ncbi:hypothetical protein J1N35_023103 [Gossypium stocksii]|uniref:Uncharacterized protein n=1 Tax=Gossypium stocksii TaxID=47602 RepID=A0A9D3VJ54_9ROSI|nr:hypothetical protein J1N35_023103 [Gossypium stocksii]
MENTCASSPCLKSSSKQKVAKLVSSWVLKKQRVVMPTLTTNPSPLSSSSPVMMLAMDITMHGEAMRTTTDTFVAIPIFGAIIMPIDQTSHLVVSLLIAYASKLGQSEGYVDHNHG